MENPADEFTVAQVIVRVTLFGDFAEEKLSPGNPNLDDRHPHHAEGQLPVDVANFVTRKRLVGIQSVRGATWAEIDFNTAVWTIPGERMKAGREHRVPLSNETVALLDALPKLAGCPLVFPSAREAQLSDMTLTAVLRRMNVPAVPHGFRSSFRDWAAECTNYPRDVAEMALAHTIGDKVEAAYRRGDLFEKRTRMMRDWAKYCGTIASKGTVTLIKGRKSA